VIEFFFMSLNMGVSIPLSVRYFGRKAKGENGVPRLSAPLAYFERCPEKRLVALPDHFDRVRFPARW